jgi:choline dehydrogenase
MSSNIDSGPESGSAPAQGQGVSQGRRAVEIKEHYDFIVCGAGSSGSVVARRLAENPDVTVLLLEAGGDNDDPAVHVPDMWPTIIGTERDWGFNAEPNPLVNDRVLPFSMGKGLGGGSAVNGMIWARGHQSDWDHFASEVGDEAWSYDSVLDIYRRIEDWHGLPDPKHRGTGGPVFVAASADPSALAVAVVDAAGALGVPTFDSPNGAMMEGHAGAALADLRIRDGKRESVFQSYVHPYMDRPNLSVLTHALVRRITFEGTRATGVEITHRETTRQIAAQAEVVLSLGAINTPKVLMQSGVGDELELARFGIPVVQHLPGVGRNFHDHLAVDCVWEFHQPPPTNNKAEAAIYWQSTSGLAGPDLFAASAAFPHSTPENAARFGLPDSSWVLFGAVASPSSRGQLHLTGADPADAIRIQANTLSEPADLKTAMACVEFLREIGNSAALRPFVKREVMPGNLNGSDLQAYLRDAATTYWHEVGTAKMGRDAMSVVDSDLKVYGIDNLRVADGSILPRITTGNTMAPCVIVGERASASITAEHRL